MCRASTGAPPRRQSNRTPALRNTASVSCVIAARSDGDTSGIVDTTMTSGGAVRLTGAFFAGHAARAMAARAAIGIVRIDGSPTRKFDVQIRDRGTVSAYENATTAWRLLGFEVDGDDVIA